MNVVVAKFEADLDRLIERWAQEAKFEEIWSDSAKRRAAVLHEGAKWEWIRYHEHMAQLHTGLAVEHRVAAVKLENGGNA